MHLVGFALPLYPRDEEDVKRGRGWESADGGRGDWKRAPRGFSRERAAKSRSGEKEKPLVSLDLNLTFMQTPGSRSDPRVRIGLYFYKHANPYNWFV